jgi:hypothetical protein
MVLHYIQNGWPEVSGEELKPFPLKKNELSTMKDCILWGSRVYIPEEGREPILMVLHEGHLGICKMKSLARMYVCWPNMDEDVERSVRLCHSCQAVQSSHLKHPYLLGNGHHAHGHGYIKISWDTWRIVCSLY